MRGKLLLTDEVQLLKQSNVFAQAAGAEWAFLEAMGL